MNYTNRIKTFMALNEIDQEEMAKKMGMSRTAFNQKLNRNGSKLFNIDEAIRISKILNVTLDQIFLLEKVTIWVGKVTKWKKNHTGFG